MIKNKSLQRRATLQALGDLKYFSPGIEIIPMLTEQTMYLRAHTIFLQKIALLLKRLMVIYILILEFCYRDISGNLYSLMPNKHFRHMSKARTEHIVADILLGILSSIKTSIACKSSNPCISKLEFDCQHHSVNSIARPLLIAWIIVIYFQKAQPTNTLFQKPNSRNLLQISSTTI